MTVEHEAENLILSLWLMIHRTDALLKMCEDRVFGEYKLGSERYGVLVTIQYLPAPVRPTDVARWVQRSPNSVSMMVDRMVRAGLIKRARDTKDRRVVRLTITAKGEEALKPATVAGWEFIRQILSALSHEDRRTLANLLRMIDSKTLEYLNPGADMEGMLRNESERHDNLRERLLEYISPSTPEAKRQGGERCRVAPQG